MAHTAKQALLSLSLFGIVSLLSLTQVASAITDAEIKEVTEAVSRMVDDDPVLGDPNAPVTLVEFSDFQCPLFRRFYNDVFPFLKSNYIDTGKAKLVFRDFVQENPDYHPRAFSAARAAECAADQGKFWEMHNVIFDEQNKQSRETVFFGVDDLKAWALNISGLNYSTWQTCFDSEMHADEVRKDLQDGISLGVTGAPTIFVHSLPVIGAQPYQIFADAIDFVFSVVIQPYNPPTLPYFNDVEKEHSLFREVQFVKEKDIVSGYTDGSFKPDNPINRSELIKILIEANFTDAEISACDKSSNNFFDVPLDHWVAPYACIAKANKILTGYADGSFRMNNTVNLAEALKLLLQNYGIPSFEYIGDGEWYERYFQAAKNKKLLFEIHLNPSDKITRGMAARLIYNAENFLEEADKYEGLTFKHSRGYQFDIDQQEAHRLSIDTRTFEQISNSDFFKDKNSIYYVEDSGRYLSKLEQADVSTFQPLDVGFYGKDNSHVYYKGIVIPDANPAKIKVFSNPLYFVDIILIDDIYVYYEDKKIDRLNPNNLHLIGANYISDGVKTYYYDVDQITEVEVDTKTFSHLGGNYFKDKNGVYCSKSKLINADPNTFVVLDDGQYSQFAKDKSRAYFSCEIFEGVDSATFRWLGGNFAGDDDRVYWHNKIHDGFESKYFEFIGGDYFKYRNKIYYLIFEVPGADALSFKFIGDDFAKDKNYLYNDGQKAEGVSPSEFRYFGKSYYAIGERVFYMNLEIIGADPKTFKVIGDDRAEDKNHKFIGNEISD